MTTTRFLSQEEKEKGRRHHFSHQRFNGAGFNFIGDTPVTLLAIHFGASNIQLGYIASAMYITGVLLLLVPRLFAGANLAKLHFWSWLFRGLVCLLYTALWFITGEKAVLLILITYTLFCSSRIIGVALYQPILRMLSTRSNRGEVVAKSSIHFQLALTLSRAVSFGVTSLSRFAGAGGLLLLQYLGILMNTVAAFQARKIPCRETVQFQKGRSLPVIFREAMGNRELRSAIFLNWTNIALMILFGFLVPFLRREALLGTNKIFLFTLTIGLSNIIAGLYAQSFADRLGSKPLLWGGSLALSACALIWFLLPPNLPFLLFLFMGLVTGFFLNSNNMLTNRLIVRVLPEGDTVGYNSMINFVVALISIGIGTGGGYLADHQGGWNLGLPNGYSLTFLLTFGAALLALVLSFRLKEPDSLTGREAMGILFSPSNLQAFWQIGRLSKTKDPVTRRTLLLHIGMAENPLATEEIRSVMARPLSVDKGELIKSLFTVPRPELLEDLLKEADNPSSYHRLKALFALGAYPGRKTEKFLERLIFDEDPAVRSNAAKSLARVGSKKHLDTIRIQAEEAEGIWNIMNYIIALKNMDDEGIYLTKLFSPALSRENSQHRQSLYSLYAKLLEFAPSLTDIYQHRNLHKGEGLQNFLEEARDHRSFLDSHQEFTKWFKKGEFPSIWRRCQEMLGENDFTPPYSYLAESIKAFPPGEGGYDDALAGLYFTYQILKNNT